MGGPTYEGFGVMVGAGTLNGPPAVVTERVALATAVRPRPSVTVTSTVNPPVEEGVQESDGVSAEAQPGGRPE